jgi:hypothetical protein
VPVKRCAGATSPERGLKDLAAAGMDETSWKERLSSPAHDWMQPWVARLPAHFPSCEDLNALLDAQRHHTASGHPLRFVTADALPAPAGYEAHVHASGAVPTRPHSWHDLFNALAWIAFPRTKRRINELHQKHLAEAAGGRRGTARDVLTLLDESGVLVACADDSLAGLVREFQWKALFCERRADVLSGMRFVVFGHALQEQALHPHPGITGKCLFIATDHEGLLQPLPELLERLDAGTAALIDAPDLLGSTRSLAPLPLLGIPGWDAASESDRYYDNRAVFRPGRR